MERRDNQQLPEHKYGADQPPPLPPRRPRPLPRRQRQPMPEQPMQPWQGLRVLVTAMVWATVVGAGIVLAMAQPRSFQGLAAQFLLLVCLPAMVLMVIAAIGSLLHSLAREGWEMFGDIGPWLLLAGMVLLIALYPKVQAIGQLPIF